MAKKKGPPQSQAVRFLEAAENAGVDKSGRKFSRAMGKIVKAKPAGKPAKSG